MVLFTGGRKQQETASDRVFRLHMSRSQTGHDKRMRWMAGGLVLWEANPA